MKVHAVFCLKANSIWIRGTSCFCKNCFNLKFQKDSRCKGWRECLLTTSTKNQRKDASEKNVDQNKELSRIVIEDSQSTSIVPEHSDYVAAIYSGKPYVGQVEEIYEEGEEAHINFLEAKGDLQRRSKFNKPKKEDKIWIPLSDIICIVPQPTATKRAPAICPDVLDVLEKFM